MIKTFEFVVNCYKGNYTQNFDINNINNLDIFKQKKVCKTEDVDKVINKYLTGKELVSMNEHFYVASNHNNGGQNTIIRSITIITK